MRTRSWRARLRTTRRTGSAAARSPGSRRRRRVPGRSPGCSRRTRRERTAGGSSGPPAPPLRVTEKPEVRRVTFLEQGRGAPGTVWGTFRVHQVLHCLCRGRETGSETQGVCVCVCVWCSGDRPGSSGDLQGTPGPPLRVRGKRKRKLRFVQEEGGGAPGTLGVHHLLQEEMLVVTGQGQIRVLLHEVQDRIWMKIGLMLCQ